MKINRLITRDDLKSYFDEIEIPFACRKELGKYTKSLSVKSATFREFEAGLVFDWHNAPQPQYVVYLRGEVEVEASGGERKRFYPGDVLLVTDMKGKGHITRTISEGLSMVVAI